VIKRLRKYFVSASFIGILIGLVSLYYTLRDRQTQLTIDIASESNVLDVLHPIPDLAIVFQGQDLEKQKQSLEVLTIRLVNDGQTDIRENDFDSRIPLGLQIDNGLVVRAQVSGATLPYLGENLHPRLSGQNQVLFDKIIFDKGSSVSVDILIIHDKEQRTRVSALGKIAGLDRILITDSSQRREQQSFWQQVFVGSPTVQLIRGLSYAFAFLIGILLIGVCIAGVVTLVSRVQKRARRSKLARLPKITDPQKQKKRKVIEELFLEDGIDALTHVMKELENPNALKDKLESRRTLLHTIGELSPDADPTPDDLEIRRAMYPQLHETTRISKLRRAGLFRLKSGELIIDPEYKDILSELIEQLSDH
jgi:hypothetical protein